MKNFIIILAVAFIANFANANQKEARLYAKELKAVWGDKPCEKVLLKYVFADCKYVDFSKGEKIENNPKCELLLKKRIECVEKAKKNEN